MAKFATSQMISKLFDFDFPNKPAKSNFAVTSSMSLNGTFMDAVNALTVTTKFLGQ